jgi:hypothetical protein
VNCSTCEDQLTAYVEGLLDAERDREVAAHLTTCAACQAHLAEVRRIQERLTAYAQSMPETSLAATVMDRIAMDRARTPRRFAMRNEYGKLGLGLAAAAVLAVALLVPWGSPRQSEATAAQVFAQAIEAAANLHSVYIKLNARTLPADNFELIGLDFDFVPHEMWKEFGPPPKWRVEKPGRVVVMDGQESLLWIHGRQPSDGGLACKAGINSGFVGWLLGLLDVDRVLDSQLRLSEVNGWDLQLTRENGPDGAPKLVVAIEARAEGDFTNDYLKNKSISAADHRRVYRFDAATKRLEDLKVWVHAQQGDVLVLEIAQIAYNCDLPAGLFTPTLPDNVVWYQEPQALADNDRYAHMSPAETAHAFFEACHAEDWDEVLKFFPVSEIEPRMKAYLGGLEVISIGEPFQSGQYPGWFVPYEIKFKMGMVAKHNLAVRNDNAAKRYMVDGGI